MQKALIAYLWEDAPLALRQRIPPGAHPWQVLLIVPAAWAARYQSLLPPALATLCAGYAPDYWGHVERIHQPDGSLLIACYAKP